MLEYWNNGMTPFGQINACGEKREAAKLGSLENNYLTDPIAFSSFHYSIIPLFLFGICRMGGGDSLLSTICRISPTFNYQLLMEKSAGTRQCPVPTIYFYVFIFFVCFTLAGYLI
jgi:hypothetical protein